MFKNETAVMAYYLKTYFLGEWVALTMLDGIVNPDMQMSNLGTRPGNPLEFLFLDYPNAKKIAMPDDINEEEVRIFTEALYPLLDDLNKDFKNVSYLRAGFLARGGIWGNCLFDNTWNNDYSSFLFLDKQPMEINKKFDSEYIYEDKIYFDLIREWKKQDFDKITIKNFSRLEDFSTSETRKNISHWNMYYLDCLYFSRVYVGLQMMGTLKAGIETALQVLYLNWGRASMAFNRPHTAMGMFYKCLSIKDLDRQVKKFCYAGIHDISESGRLLKESIEYIKSISELDMFSLQWILRDMDRSV